MKITIKLDSLDVIHAREEMERLNIALRRTAEEFARAALVDASDAKEEQRWRNASARALREIEQNQRIIDALERALNKV